MGYICDLILSEKVLGRVELFLCRYVVALFFCSYISYRVRFALLSSTEQKKRF